MPVILTVAEVCRRYDVSQSTYFKWKSKYGGHLSFGRARAGKQQAKRMYTDLSLECHALNDLAAFDLNLNSEPDPKYVRMVINAIIANPKSVDEIINNLSPNGVDVKTGVPRLRSDSRRAHI